MGGYAWVTLATNDSYSLGALVLAHSLKKARTAHKSVVLITPAVSKPMREQLQTVFDVVKVVDVLDSKDEAHLALMQRPELGITFTKIHCWRMTEFDKCVFLDADTLVVRNCDELFEREEFSAAPDVSWPDCFNSGVFVYKPSVETFNKLLQFAVEKGSFDGGDQGLLNQFFSDWATEDIKKHLPFVYNLTSVAAYSYIPAFKHYGAETRIVHFIGAGKPWLQQLDPATRTVTPAAGSEHLTPLLQQWWDLFCEKVHPALDKNLESNNDGISHPPVEACSNSLPIALTDDSQTPRLIGPCTPYREKDDFRQYNLPYQPFDVRGSSGELLNVEFLLASVVQSTPQDDRSDEQQRQEHGGIEETNKNENGNEKENGIEFETEKEREEPSDLNEKENRSKGEIERQNIIMNASEHLETQKETCERTRAEEEQFKQEEEQKQQRQQQKEEQKEEPQQQEQSEEPERPSPPPHPFDYNSFFPDEACVNNYLEQNVITYQPYDNHHHHHHYHQPNEDQPHHASERSCQHAHETGTEVNSSSGDPQPEESSPALPRFLTIPEDDRRQSGNVETSARPSEPEPQSDLPATNAPAEETRQREQAPRGQEPEGKRELTKSKSMPYLRFDVTEVPPPRSVWKSQPDVSVEGSRRYSMPKLKPILPRQNSLSKSLPLAMPKVTLYTEFLMSAEYKDPADLPKDKVGFVEKLISRGQLRRSKSAADIAHRFGPLPYASPETEQPTVLRKTPLHHLDNELYDLSQCKRQMGNKPKTKTDRRKENSHPLPALKPLGAAKDKKSVLIKKRKSKELSPSDGGREKILKREPRKPKDRKRETKIIPRNVSETSNGNNVNDILKRLREFSKNYQHFFGEVPQRGDRTRYRNAAMQTGEAPEAPTESNTAGGFLKTSAPRAATASKATQTVAREEKSVDLEFRNFRSYVQEKSKTSQKGLLGIQELVSKPEEETSESVKVLTEAPKNSGELKKNKVDDEVNEDRKVDVSDTVDSGRKLYEMVDKQETLSVHQQNFFGKDETPRTERSDELKTLIITNSSSSKTENSNEAFERNSLSSLAAENMEPFASDTKPTATVHDHTEEISAPPTVHGGGESVPSSPEEKTGTSGSARETFEEEKAQVKALTRNEASRDDATESFKREMSSGSNCAETLSKMSEDVCSYPKVEKEVLPDKLSVEEVVEVTTLFEESKSDGRCRKERSGEKAAKAEVSRCGQKDRRKSSKLVEKPRNPDEILCVPDFDTPRTSRVALPAAAAAELLEERAGAREGRGSPGSPASPALPNGRPPPDGSQDGPPPSPPRATPNGTPLPPAQQELPSRSGIAGAIAQLSLEATSAQSLESATAASTAHQEYLRRQNWETGNMDYMGRDSFDNIWSKICQTLEGKDLEEAALAAAAVSPKAFTDPSTATPKEETKKPEKHAVTAPTTPSAEAPTPAAAPAPVEETPSTASPATPPPAPSAPTPPAPATTPEGAPSVPPPATPASSTPADLHKCPEYIDTLPGDPVPGPAEDDEIIFSKADDRPSRLSNISEEREAGVESSAKARNVKLSDILGPKESTPVEMAAKPSEQGSAAVATETKTTEGKAPVAEDDGGKPQPVKTECTTVAICQQHPPPVPPTQVSQIEKTEGCTTVAIPSPPIVFPGAPFGDKGKGETVAEKFDPIPLPPPETPPAKFSETAPLALRENTQPVDSPKEEGKQKEGVISKILKIVGVTPKEKNGGDISKSVFYDVEGAAAPSKQESPTCESESAPVEAKKKAAVTEMQLETLIPAAEKEAPPKRPDDAHVATEGAGESIQQVKKDETVPSGESKEAKKFSPQTVEQTGAEVAPLAPGATETRKNIEQKASESEKSGQTVEKAKAPVEKPARNVSPKKQMTPPTDVIHSSPPKNKSPSPKLALPQTPPVTTAVTLPTPPPQTELPPRKDSALLKVDETIPETPPVPQTSNEGAADAPKSKVFAEVDDIIDKAKNEVESLLQDRRSAEKNSPEGAELISAMKLMVGDDRTAQPPTPTTEVEELKVTSEEDRVRHKSEVPSSKLSDQILKAIPPPRRKAISESSAPAPAPPPPPAPAIPSPPPSPSPSSSPAPAPPPAPASASAPQQKTPKGSKPSSIPVPPPRNRGKPQQTTPTPTPATPSKGKPKK